MSIFNTKTFIIKRASGKQTYNKAGRLVDSEATEIEIKGSLHPTSGRQIQSLLEGKKYSSLYKIITGTKLNTYEVKTQMKGDVVEIDGDDYDVISEAKHSNGIISHYTYTVARKGELV